MRKCSDVFSMRFEVSRVVTIWIVVFWVMPQRSVISDYEIFGGTGCLNLHVALKMEAVCYSETLLSTYQTAWCHDLEEYSINFHDRVKVELDLFRFFASETDPYLLRSPHWISQCLQFSIVDDRECKELKYTRISWILGSHGGGYEQYGLLDCNAL
jgi:hypothetical protein